MRGAKPLRARTRPRFTGAVAPSTSDSFAGWQPNLHRHLIALAEEKHRATWVRTPEKDFFEEVTLACTRARCFRRQWERRGGVSLRVRTVTSSAHSLKSLFQPCKSVFRQVTPRLTNGL